MEIGRTLYRAIAKLTGDVDALKVDDQIHADQPPSPPPQSTYADARKVEQRTNLTGGATDACAARLKAYGLVNKAIANAKSDLALGVSADVDANFPGLRGRIHDAAMHAVDDHGLTEEEAARVEADANKKLDSIIAINGPRLDHPNP